MRGVNPVTSPELWDVLYVAGQPSPGIAQVTGFSRSSDWDVKKAKGSSGASATLQGEPLAKGKAKFLLWLPAHFAAWDDFRVLLKSGQKDAKKITALDVQYPDLADLEIHSIVTEDVGQLVDEGGGLSSVTVDILEYRAPTKAGGTPNAAQATQWTDGPNGNPQKPDSAASQQEKELDDLLKKAKAA